jgi:hypothetical protein
MGFVTERGCGRRYDCKETCRCAPEALVPVELSEWPEFFQGNYQGVRVLDEGVSTSRFLRRDVVEIAHLAPGSWRRSRRHRGVDSLWIAVVRLADDRWVFGGYQAESSEGFDDLWSVAVAGSRRQLWWRALSDEVRERLTPQLTTEQRDEELVQIDELLQSLDAEDRALGERRMRQLHR